jgi:hypothetical protein
LRFGSAGPTLRPGIAWALGKKGNFSANDLLESCVDDNSRQWISYILGMRDSKEFVHELEMLKVRDPEVYFAATVLWKIVSSWVYDLKEYG